MNKIKNFYFFPINANNNNTYLYYYINNYFFKNSVSVKNKLTIKNDFFFFNFFLQKYFTSKIKSKCYFQIFSKNFLFLDNNKYFNWIILLIKRLNILNLTNLKLIKKFLEIYLIFMYTKDTSFLSNWLKHIMEDLYYKNHKKFLMFFKNILFFLFKYLKTFFKINGLKFLIKGKISLGGNSKKKKFKINLGACSLTKKNNYINFNKDYIRTVSGTLGYTIFIFF